MFKILLNPLLLLIFAAGWITGTLAKAPFPTSLVYESPTGQFLECLAIRPNGHLLITSVVSPTLYTLDPKASPPTLNELHTFPNATALNGIVEYANDTFAVVVSRLSVQTISAPLDSVVIWSVAFTPNTNSSSSSELFSTRPLARIPSSPFTNGITAVPGHPDLLLAADSQLGVAWEVNVRTGTTRIAVADESMEPGFDAILQIGLDGVRAHDDGFLYFTNAIKGLFARVSLTRRAPVEVLGRERAVIGGGENGTDVVYDDFVFDERGRAVVAFGGGEVRRFEKQRGKHGKEKWVQEVIAESSLLAGATAVAFGRGGDEEKKLLYATTTLGRVVVVDMSEKSRLEYNGL
ncbi:hypothetical protein R3P38DRAFT_3482038 [Favolaschia claudopus]|uniref:SMP-30/Gluconolactonase/LRE-like region domain-containing protein n=1 Tax=Favolaschia claudopus TaxID=2862362 RepID=A0AAV9Z810_9AGAR